MLTLPDNARILIYGDSNTFGWHELPDGKVIRYRVEDIWPYRLAGALGKRAVVEVDGLSGRTSAFDRPGADGNGTGSIPGMLLNGATWLPAALSKAMPLDLVIIMLGTNDFNAQLQKSPQEAAQGVVRLIDIVRDCSWRSATGYKTPDILVLAPAPLNVAGGPNEKYFPGGQRSSEVFASVLEPVVRGRGAFFFDVSTCIAHAHDTDGVHFSEEDHRILAAKLAEFLLADGSR